MAREKKQPIIHGAVSGYIDPASCDSTVSYKVVTDEYGRFFGAMSLADCTRKIEWHFENDDSSVAKIDNTIKYLREFRKTFIAGRRGFLKLKSQGKITPE